MTNKPIRWVLWVFALAAAAVLLALAGRYGSGYAVFVVPPWRIELSMMMFSLIVVVSALLLYALVRLSIRAYQLPLDLRERKVANERQKVMLDLHNGMKSLFGGRFDDAEKLARRAMMAKSGVNQADEDIHNLAAALAAWAAHEGGNLPAALPYLEKITGHKAANMRDASKAYMLLAEGRATEALPVLRSLAANDPGNVGALKMKVEAEIAAKEWDEVLLTLGPLKRTGLLPQHAVDEIRLNAEIELMKSRPAERDALVDAWRKLDNHTRYQPRLADALANRLIAVGLGKDAAKIIEETVDRCDQEQWEDALASLTLRYADANSGSTTAQIECAESWLEKHPREASLLAALGKLCMRQGLWGKAQSYLEASVAMRPTVEAHMTLARLMEQVGKPQDAMSHIKRSAELAKGPD